MNRLRKFVAPEFIFGAGSRALVARYAANLGCRRLMVVTDEGVAQAGWAAEALRHLDEAGLSHVLFADVSPNPRAEQVMAGAARYLAERCDGLLAVGGGSAIDCAKGIGIVASNRGHILDFEGVDRVDQPSPPLICIPTTAGASADISQFVIISDIDRRTKVAIVSKMTVPDVSLIDPVTTTTMDPQLTAVTGLDALVHAVEAFVSRASSPIVDIHALEAIRLVHDTLPTAVAEPQNLAAREAMMSASMHAGLAFSNACLGAVHAMSHSLGGLLDLPHGECNALLLEHVVAFNYEAAPERFDRMAQIFGIDPRNLPTRRKVADLCAEISAFRRSLGVGGGLGDRGVTASALADLVDNAMADVCLVTNPREMKRRDVELVYGEAL